MAEKRIVVNFDQLIGGTRHKERYGRATLTIRSRGGLTDASELAQLLERYQERAAPADEVVRAFITARVESTSPTFDWAQADHDRVLELVASCSDTPKITDTSADAVAQALLQAREEEIKEAHEAFLRLGESLNKSISGSIQGLAKSVGLVQSQRWAESQAGVLQSISKQFSASRTAARFPVPRLGPLAATATFPSTFLSSLKLQFPQGPSDEIARSFRASLAGLDQSPPPAFAAIMASQAFDATEISGAVAAAARIVRDQNEPAYAARLSEIGTSFRRVTRQPTPANVEQFFGEIADDLRAMEERAIEREQTAEAKADQRDQRQREEATDKFEIAMYVTLLIFVITLLLYLIPPPPADPQMSPPQQTTTST